MISGVQTLFIEKHISHTLHRSGWQIKYERGIHKQTRNQFNEVNGVKWARVCVRACSCVSVVVNASWSDCRAVSLKHRDSSCRYLSVWIWIRCMQVCMLVRVHLQTDTITNSGLFSVLLLMMFKVIIPGFKPNLVWFDCFCVSVTDFVLFVVVRYLHARHF